MYIDQILTSYWKLLSNFSITPMWCIHVQVLISHGGGIDGRVSDLGVSLLDMREDTTKKNINLHLDRQCSFYHFHVTWETGAISRGLPIMVLSSTGQSSGLVRVRSWSGNDLQGRLVPCELHRSFIFLLHVYFALHCSDAVHGVIPQFCCINYINKKYPKCLILYEYISYINITCK